MSQIIQSKINKIATETEFEGISHEEVAEVFTLINKEKIGKTENIAYQSGFQKSINPTTPIPEGGWGKGIYPAEISGTYINQNNIVVDLNNGFTALVFDGENWESFVLPFGIDDIFTSNSERLSNNSAIFDFLKKETATANLFNKETFIPDYGFNSQNGDIAYRNAINGISDLIPAESNTTYGVSILNNRYNANSQVGNSLRGIYIVEYDTNKKYIGYIELAGQSTFKTKNSTAFFRINPNSSDGFDNLKNQLVIAKASEFPFGYVGYGDFEKVFQNDMPFFQKQFFLNNSTTNVADGFTFSSETLKITTGEKNLLGKNLFTLRFAIENTGKAKVVIKLKGNVREFLPLLLNETSLIYNEANPNQPSIFFYKGKERDEFFIVAEGSFAKDNGVIFYKNSSAHIKIENEINCKVECFVLYLDSDGKPRNSGASVQELNDIVTTQISEKVPNFISQTIGLSVDSYIAKHINDFQFLQPNYIQANADFDFRNLTSAMNGKFISIIQDIDLGGNTIDFEALNVKNIKLVFNGGRILNGKMKSFYTRCIFNSAEAFKNVEILNQFQNDFALPEWFGAAIDGVDAGIGNFTKDDSFAINQALKFASTVRLSGKRTMIVKKPIIMRSGNTIQADKNFTVKLGDASNCTLLKNEHIDIPHDGVNPVVYPSGFVRNANISITGGIWEGNGLKQNRANNPAVGDQADIIGTPIFADGDGASYFGCMMKFADIDNFTFTDAVIKDPRTYGVALGGLLNYRFENIRLIRTYHVENGDGIHLHGKNYNGVLKNINGQSGDDFIAVTTSEAQRLSIRVGDVIGLTIKDIYTYGLVDGATPAAPKNITNGIPPNTRSMRCVRLSYTDHLIDDVYIENVRGHGAKFMNNVCIAYLHHSLFTGAEGKVGNVTISGITDTDGCNAVSYGANTLIDKISVKNVYYRYSGATEIPALMRPADNFGGSDQWGLTKIGTICIDNVHLVKDNDTFYDMMNGLIWSVGTIDNLIIDKLIIDTKSGLNHFDSLVSGPVGNINITNSIINLKKFFSSNEVYNNYTNIRESGNEFASEFILNGVPKRANTESLVLASNPSLPKLGDKILKADGLYLYTNTWNKL